MGYYTFRFAELVGDGGKVFAADIDKSSLDYIAEEARAKNLDKRIICVPAGEESSNLPEDTFDLLFFRNSFHHIKNRAGYFKDLKKSLKIGGRVVIIDHKKGHRSGPGIGHQTGEGVIETVMEQAGYIPESTFGYLPGQWFFIYKKGSRGEAERAGSIDNKGSVK